MASTGSLKVTLRVDSEQFVEQMHSVVWSALVAFAAHLTTLPKERGFRVSEADNASSMAMELDIWAEEVGLGTEDTKYLGTAWRQALQLQEVPQPPEKSPPLRRILEL